MEELKYKTFTDFLNTMATTTVCDDTDEAYMSYLLKYIIGVPNVSVVVGLVYGLGFNGPVDIHTAAREIQKALVAKGIIQQEDIMEVKNDGPTKGG